MIPRNGIYIIQGELNHVVAALRRNNRWSGGHFSQEDDQDPLLNSFTQLKETLQGTTDVNELDVNVFLGPFLEVIRSEDTTGPITGVALSSVNKFLSYGLIDPSVESARSGIDNLADAVTHARFVGTDPSSDEVVLMKILQVLRTLLLSPVGIHMTNESVCEIMQSCFRICFEMRLSELLRRTAEQTLIDMVQLLFLRLPQFKEDFKSHLSAPHIRKMFKRSGPLASSRRGARKSKRNSKYEQSSNEKETDKIDAKASEENHSEVTEESAHPEIIERSHSDSEQLEVKGSIDVAAHKVSCDDIDLSLRKKKKVTLTDAANTASTASIELIPENSLVMVDADKMKSINEGLDIVCQEGYVVDESQIEVVTVSEAESDSGKPVSDTEEMSNDFSNPTWTSETNETGGMDDMSPTKNLDSPLPTDSDAEAKEKDTTVLENFSDHGVISLHYPEEETSQANEVEVEDEKSMSESLDIVDVTMIDEADIEVNSDYINQQGVRFMVQETQKEGHEPLVPYGLPCVRELLRFLTTLINPHDRHNTNTMIHIGLSLLTVALESGAVHIGHFSSLMQLVKDDVCRNIFALLQCDIHILFALSMRVSFLLFEALRGNLKYQLERFFLKLMEILSLDNLNVPYEKREMALEYINQMFHIPLLVQELYVNFDCDLHSTNSLEDLCKTLSKNAFRPGNLSSVNLLALDSLLTIVNECESHCRSTAVIEAGVPEKERTVSGSSEMTADYESPDELECDISHTALSTSGYAVGKRLLDMGLTGINKKKIEEANKSITSPEVVDAHIPTPEEIVTQKLKKKLLYVGIEEFNKKPKTGIASLTESGLLSTPFNPDELVYLFKENQLMDKKTVGDYIGDRKNTKILESFVKSFEMSNVRIDEALRSFLESFRLPGESPVIALILEEFTNRYFEANKSPYKNTDAAFTMAYAVIMLNVDQHNKNVKQQKSMTVDEFKKNLRQTNGGEDFPAELLESIYENIRTNEIVMPSERVGKVKEAYEWKVLIRKCLSPESFYTHVNSSLYDKELFLVVWGPTLAALSYVYENSLDKANIQKAIQGFRKCASISSFYNLSEVFDNLLMSLCRFTGLLKTDPPSDNLSVLFGGNLKSQLSIRTAFSLAHKQGDIVREGWNNLLVCIRQLLKAKMLPTSLTEVEDFVDQSGKVSLIRDEPLPAPKQDNTGVFAAFYSYMIANPDTSSKSVLNPEDHKAQEIALSCIKECKPENIITESKFLRPESLQELTKALIIASKPEHSYESTDVPYDGNSSVFFLEFIIKIALQNRDRISLLWQSLRDHLSNIIISAPKVSFLVERAVVGLLRLAIRLIRRDDISGQVLITLRILLMMHPDVLLSCSKEISYGLHELIRTNASNIHYSHDWITILTLIQVVGAGASPPIVKPGPCLTLISGDLYSAVCQEEKVDTETGEETGEKPSERTEKENRGNPEAKVGEQWLLINKNEDEDIPINQYDLKFKEKLNKHDAKVFMKASSSISFIVRDMAHVRDFNIFQCIYAVLLFGEASANGGLIYKIDDDRISRSEHEKQRSVEKKSKSKGKRLSSPANRRSAGGDTVQDDDEEGSTEDASNRYGAISLQLLDLMYALHINSSKILGSMTWEEFSQKQREEVKARWSSKESIDQLPSTFRGDFDHEMMLLWVKCWCPLMQGIARLCCDLRRDIRMAAITVLQRALLAEDLQSLTATEWENCFNQVLFPMLASLLDIPPTDPCGLEETRMRAATLLCKAFLQHLNTLISLTTFTALWMTILDFMDKYMHADNSDLLFEAIPESLKNMLLVMSTAGIFEYHQDLTGQADSESQPQHLKADLKSRQYSALWQVTWERIDCFLPNLKGDLIATRSPVSMRAVIPPEPDEPGVMTMHAEGDNIVRTASTEPSTPVEDTTDKTIIQTPVKGTISNNSELSANTLSTPTAALTSTIAAAADRASSPLLSTEDPPHMNIQLIAPLPALTPPGNVIPIHDNQSAHPIPILLPPIQSLTLGQDVTTPTAPTAAVPISTPSKETVNELNSNDDEETTNESNDVVSDTDTTSEKKSPNLVTIYDI